MHTESPSLVRVCPGAPALHVWAQGPGQLRSNKHTLRTLPRRPQLKASAAMEICRPPISAPTGSAEGRARMDGRVLPPSEDPASFHRNSGWALAKNGFQRRLYYCRFLFFPEFRMDGWMDFRILFSDLFSDPFSTGIQEAGAGCREGGGWSSSTLAGWTAAERSSREYLGSRTAPRLRA